jgi:hypothetical protein
MKKLTKNDLPNTWQSDKKSGIYAEFDKDGFLTHYGFYGESNDTVEHFSIAIDYENWRSVVERYDERRFLAFDPALDVDDKLTIDEAMSAFVKKWVGTISEEGSHSPPDCSFCGRNSSEVQKLVAGPRSYICNDCIEVCADMVKKS